MNIIEELYKNQRSHHFEIKDEILVCGGTDDGRFYGLIELFFSKDGIIVDRTVSDGFSQSMILAALPYSSFTEEYRQAIQLRKEVREFLAKPEGQAYQEINRLVLISNIQKLLPSFSELSC